MRENCAGIFLLALLLAAISTTPASADTALVYSVNFDLRFIAGDGTFGVQNHARVRNGHAIPVSLSNYRVEIRIVETTAPDEYSAEIGVFEKTQGSWFNMNLEIPAFTGTNGIPVEYEWKSDDITVNLALIASRAPM